MISRWSSANKGWTTKKKILGATHWYIAGQKVGQRPIYDSVCAFCGSLLFGSLNSTELGNKRSGKPVTVDEKVTKATRTASLKMQPPFLLRWSSRFLAERLPDVFEWQSKEKRLVLRESHRERPPWMRKHHSKDKNEDEVWLYCDCCHPHLFDPQSSQPHVPFRDEHSSAFMTQAPPTATGKAASTELEKRDAQAWARKRNDHARSSGGRFSLVNLVPTAQPTRWQHVPYVPFDQLKSQTAVSRLSLCKLDNCMEPSGMQGGRTVYASQRGDTNFWRRNPQQVSGTLAFMLTRDECAEFEIRAEEVPFHAKFKRNSQEGVI